VVVLLLTHKKGYNIDLFTKVKRRERRLQHDSIFFEKEYIWHYSCGHFSLKLKDGCWSIDALNLVLPVGLRKLGSIIWVWMCWLVQYRNNELCTYHFYTLGMKESCGYHWLCMSTMKFVGLCMKGLLTKRFTLLEVIVQP
jgi:hypothetical protein